MMSMFWQIPDSAYVHIPFCRRRCFYCDFPITVIGNRIDPSSHNPIAIYVDWLIQEIKFSLNLGKSLKTIFFGGGTPSLLPTKYLDKILQALNHKFGFALNLEISLEIDPGTFTAENLREYQKLGINRLSLGVQAFQDELLTQCGRFHTVKDIWQSVKFLEQVGFDNFSLDLISGLPDQSLEQWNNSLSQAISIKPKHISSYDLVLESSTAFGKKYKAGNLPLPSDENSADMYRLAQRQLTQAGYGHYEISNYAQDGYQCRHNRVYWENLSYYAFGVGAASYIEGTRYVRPRNSKQYFEYVKGLDNPIKEKISSQNTQQDFFLETLMLGLRLVEGLRIEYLKENFGEDIVNSLISLIKPYQAQGWVNLTQKRIILSDPEGFLFSNVVLTKIFQEFS